MLVDFRLEIYPADSVFFCMTAP